MNKIGISKYNRLSIVFLYQIKILDVYNLEILEKFINYKFCDNF